MREDQDAEGARRFDEPGGGDRLAGRGRVAEPVAAHGARIRPRVPLFLLRLGVCLVVEDVLRRVLDRLVLFLLGHHCDRAVSVRGRFSLVRGDELGEHPGERVDLVSPKLRPGSKVRPFLGEHALEPEHEAVLHLPRGCGRPPAGVDLGNRIVERAASRRSGCQNLGRILALSEQGLASPGFRSEGGGRKTVRCLRRCGRLLCDLLHVRSAYMRCNCQERTTPRIP